MNLELTHDQSTLGYGAGVSMMTSSISARDLHRVLNSSGITLAACLARLLFPLLTDLTLSKIKLGATELIALLTFVKKGSERVSADAEQRGLRESVLGTL